jgi:hypothetical protein
MIEQQPTSGPRLEVIRRYHDDAAFHAIINAAANIAMRPRGGHDIRLDYLNEFASLLYTYQEHLVRENASMKDSVQRLHMAVSPTFVIERGADPVVMELVKALRELADNVWKVAKESFDTNEGQAEQDFHESDAEGFEAWAQAIAALAAFENAQLVAKGK